MAPAGDRDLARVLDRRLHPVMNAALGELVAEEARNHRHGEDAEDDQDHHQLDQREAADTPVTTHRNTSRRWITGPERTTPKVARAVGLSTDPFQLNCSHGAAAVAAPPPTAHCVPEPVAPRLSVRSAQPELPAPGAESVAV